MSTADSTHETSRSEVPQDAAARPVTPPATGRATGPLLATSVVGSYSVPEWLQRLKTDYYRHRISRAHLDEVHDTAIKAAIKDQERAGIDFVSDGELRRDNDVDYLLARTPGVYIPNRLKSFFYDYYEAEVGEPIPGGDAGALGFVQDFTFTAAQTDRAVNFSFTGPFSLSRRVRNKAYADDAELVYAFARVLNAEAHRLIEAGAANLQIDEPFLAGYPEQVDVAIEAVNLVTKDVPANWSLHVCYGNRHARPSWEGHYDFLFPSVLAADVDRLVLEFARKGYDDLGLLDRYQPTFALGLGVIDVKSEDIESADVVAARVRRALNHLPAEQLMINPDCGLRHLPGAVARAKLAAMVRGAAVVRAELSGAVEPGGRVSTRDGVCVSGQAPADL
jgi:5-methyltetrahydropteroyltriglutamate--homocysteine methyltransferase